MEWWVLLSAGITLLLAVFLTGAPIFVAFLIINSAGVLVLLGQRGFGLYINSIFETTNIAALSAIPLFILMGELLFRSSSVDVLFESVDRLVGRVRGRQYVLCIALSTIFGALSGAAMGVAAMMGRTLFPSMLKRGYDAKMSTGSILAGASLAPIIPPSLLAIIIGSIADVSIAGLLIAGILPGLLLAALFLTYLMVRVRFDPKLAPAEKVDAVPAFTATDKMIAVARMLPFTLVIFCVMGFILLGVATPSESAATGVAGAILTAAYYRRLSLRMVWESLQTAAFITSMILIIMASSTMFSQLLAFTGATGKLSEFVAALGFEPMLMLFVLLFLPFVLFMFVDQIALLLVMIPIYQPVLVALGFDPIWFWLLMLLNATVGGITPPFGYTMFAFKGSAPHILLGDIYSAVWPFVILILLGMFIIAAFPPIATFLPSLM